jgi:deoxyribonuclease V
VIVATDVHYFDEGHARAAAVDFAHWTDAAPISERTAPIDAVADYQPGQFYKRELPCLHPLIEPLEAGTIIVVDGHAWLAEGQRGLGAWLYDAYEGRYPVIGVAKNRYHQGIALPLRRGDSQKPLWISACGFDPAAAVQAIAQMHGPFRLPTLFKHVDRLARDGA